MPETYRLLGGPGSPYSMKLRAILRYRRLPHVWLIPNGYLSSGGELKEAGKSMIPVLQYPDGSYWADSTPLAYALEARHPANRSIMPPDPGQAFISHLIEDFADELLVAAMFDMRWGPDLDQRFCAVRQLSGWMSPVANDLLLSRVAQFTQRQSTQRAKLVQGDNHGILIELYNKVLALVEGMLEHTAFLFGGRPSLGDFGLYGQLVQCAIDPSASAIMRRDAIRTFQWTQLLDDASGVEGEWLAPEDCGHALEGLLELIGSMYLPFLWAHAQGVVAGSDKFSVPIGDLTWKGSPKPYKLSCLIWLRRELADMPVTARERIRPMLERHGCWDALQPDALNEADVPAMHPV
jgi:glutathione S-transferase